MSEAARCPSATVSAYILAGGRSVRMGRDKALIELAGRPLIAHAADKLRRVGAEVAILSADPALARYGPLVPDLHFGTGPIGGIEAALAHTTRDWNLIYPVDVPLIPEPFLVDWFRTLRTAPPAHASFFRVAGMPQPTLLLIHRGARPVITDAVERGAYKLLPVLEQLNPQIRDLAADPEGWFLNVNTPADLAEAERLLRV